MALNIDKTHYFVDKELKWFHPSRQVHMKSTFLQNY